MDEPGATRRTAPTPMCPIRPDQPCSLCFPGADGPQNCGLVYLVQSDPDMAQELNQRRSAYRREHAAH